MALDYKDVLDLYDTLHTGSESLPEWSTKMNQLTGTDLYAAGLHDNLIKRGSARLDQLIEKTGIPEYGAQIGRSYGAAVGDEAAGEQVGRGLGRMTVNVAPLLIPGAGWGATLARLGGTAALSGAETYTSTGSPAAGLLSGATAAALPKVANVAEQYALKKLGGRLVAGQLDELAARATGLPEGQFSRYFPTTTGQKIGGAVGGQVGAAGLFGASGAGQELLAGETPSSPLSTENLISLTLGQAPFALAHLGGRALGIGGHKPTSIEQADSIQRAIDLSKIRTDLKTAKADLENQSGVEKLPTVERPAAEDLTPKQVETERQTRILMQEVRGEQIAIKDDPNLTPQQKLEMTNKSLNKDFELQRRMQVQKAGDTIFGNGIHEDTPRQEIVGRQLKTNANGTWRVVEVANDPFNPEELRGRVIGYSTKNEPNPRFGIESMEAPYGNYARFSLPDSQWWTHNKSSEEWASRYPRKEPTVVSPVDQPPLPMREEPMSNEEVSAHLHELENIRNEITAADSPGEAQAAVVKLNGVEAENNLPTTNDSTIKKSADRLVAAGFNPDEAVKATVKSRATKIARTVEANAKSLREQEREAPEPTTEEAADIAARFEGKGYSIQTADKLSHSHAEESVDTQPLKDVVTDQAVESARSPKAQAAFNTWEGRADTKYEKDFIDFLDLVQNYMSLSNVNPEEAAQLLNARSGTITWDANEVKDFINRPHVQEWSLGLDDGLYRMQQVNKAPIPISVLHGTPYPEFTQFEHASERTDLEHKGFYFTDQPATAEVYAKLPPDYSYAITEGQNTEINRRMQKYVAEGRSETEAEQLARNEPGRIIQAKLTYDNPKVIDLQGAKWDYNTYENAVKQAQQEGHDALIVKNVNDTNVDGAPLGNTTIVFDPKQIEYQGEQPSTRAGISTEAKLTRGRAPIWTPTEQRDVDTMQQMGIGQGGRGLQRFVSQSKNPLLSALGRDLAKFTDSMDRTDVVVRDADAEGFVQRRAGGRFEISFSPGLLRSGDHLREYAAAHELVHTLSLAELDNPTNRTIVTAIDDLRERVIDKLPSDMKRAINTAIESDWYRKWANGETTLETLMPKGTEQQRDILYGLLTKEEFVAQGLSENNLREHLKSIKFGKETWYSQFTNLLRTLLRLDDDVSNTAFGEFLSKTDQLLERSNHVASFRNFSDRYFENMGMDRTFVNSNTQRAMGLILNTNFRDSPASALTLLRMGTGGIRTPEWATAQRDAIRMFNERGEDAMNTQGLLGETGHSANLSGLTDLADSLMLGEVGHDVLDTFPESAARYVAETVKDAHNIFGALRAATHENNKGVLNIAEPQHLRGTIGETADGIAKVVEASRLREEKISDMKGLLGVTPDNYMTDIVRMPEKTPEWVTGEDEATTRGFVARTLEPTAQIAQRIPESAEAINRGFQLKANVRHMAREALKVFGMDLTKMDLTEGTVKAMGKVFGNTNLRRAADRWIAENNIQGEKSAEIKVLDVDDPRIQKIVGHLSTGDRDIVEDMVNKHSISTQHMQQQMLEMGLKIESTNGGALIQKLTGLKLKDSVELASRLLNAFTANRSDPELVRKADAEIQLVQSKMDPDQFLSAARFTKSAADTWMTQKQFFQQNQAWSTARRFGKFLVEFKKGGKVILDAVDSKKEAEQLAEGRPFKLTKNSQFDEDRPPSLGFDAPGIANRLRELEQNRRDILKNTGTFTDEQLATMDKYSASEQFITEQTYRGGTKGLQPQPRRLTKGAEDLPWLRNHVSWVHSTSNYWSRQLLRAQARAHLMDPEIASNEQLSSDLRTHFENMLQPDSATGRFFQRSAMTWFMGFNPASALINSTQPFLTHVAEMTAMTGKPLDSYRRTLSALKEVYSSGLGRLEWKDPVTREFMKRFIKDGEADASMFDDQAAANELLHTNLVKMLSGDKPQTMGQKLSSMAGNASTMGMWMFKTVERINAMSAGIASYKYYRESQPNLNLDEAYAKAVQYHHAVNYGGGAAARPIGAFSGRGNFPRTVAMLATAMQSYNLGTTFQLARYIRSGFFRPSGLTPHEIYSARTAAVQMLATQFAAAGVLGLPFVSGMLSVLNQAFPGLEVNRHLREWMNAVTGGDEEHGSVLNDIAMTGAPSMLGWDMQSRLSMGNTVPGVSEVNGFQPELLAGAPGNLVSTFIKGGYKLASGQPGQAFDAFMPSALKKLEQLLRSGGQVLDYRNRPIFTPTVGEAVGIGLGFNPKRLSDFNRASRIATQADENLKRREGQFHQSMAEEVLRGNFGNVRQALQQRISEDKTYDPAAAVRSIAGASEELTFPRDLRREGTARGSDVRARLLSSFNLPATQPSEVDRLNFRQGVQQRLGLMAKPRDSSTATVMDELRRQNPDASRAELRRQATLLLSGHRRQTLALPPE